MPAAAAATTTRSIATTRPAAELSARRINCVPPEGAATNVTRPAELSTDVGEADRSPRALGIDVDTAREALAPDCERGVLALAHVGREVPADAALRAGSRTARP